MRGNPSRLTYCQSHKRTQGSHGVMIATHWMKTPAGLQCSTSSVPVWQSSAAPRRNPLGRSTTPEGSATLRVECKGRDARAVNEDGPTVTSSTSPRDAHLRALFGLEGVAATASADRASRASARLLKSKRSTKGQSRHRATTTDLRLLWGKWDTISR
eukprot:6039120-Pleurochrysis_carterae.AAC.3